MIYDKIIKQVINMIRKLRDSMYFVLGTIYFKINKINLNILSIDETIEIAKNNSVIRFGDGEIALINGKDIVYQRYNKELSMKLMEIINLNESNLLICLPDIFDNMKKYNFKDRYFHVKFMYYYRSFFEKSLKNNFYGNTFMSRPYIIFKNKDNSLQWFNQLKELWNDKDIVIIEGNKSKSGVGNTLFEKVRSIERIICPSEDAFNKHQEIITEIIKMDKNKLYLFALGPTAKIIIYELTKQGFHCIDIGHLDSEYEWFLKNVKVKVQIEGKHTAEFKDDTIAQEINDFTYFKQIIRYIN